MVLVSGPREPGRREQNKADKLRRIRTAARELFYSRGFSSVTTQEVADLAEVGTGTLFRYAHSKGELLCMVANEEFTAIVESVPDTGDPVEDLLVLCDAVIAVLALQPETGLDFRRETLFAEPRPHRAEALRRRREVRRTVGAILARRTGHGQDDPPLGAPARTVFDVPYLHIVRSEVDADP